MTTDPRGLALVRRPADRIAGDDLPVLVAVDVKSIDHSMPPPSATRYRKLVSIDPDEFLRRPHDMLAEVALLAHVIGGPFPATKKLGRNRRLRNSLRGPDRAGLRRVVDSCRRGND